MSPLPHHDTSPGILKENTELFITLGVISHQEGHLLEFGNQSKWHVYLRVHKISADTSIHYCTYANMEMKWFLTVKSLSITIAAESGLLLS